MFMVVKRGKPDTIHQDIGLWKIKMNRREDA